MGGYCPALKAAFWGSSQAMLWGAWWSFRHLKRFIGAIPMGSASWPMAARSIPSQANLPTILKWPCSWRACWLKGTHTTPMRLGPHMSIGWTPVRSIAVTPYPRGCGEGRIRTAKPMGP